MARWLEFLGRCRDSLAYRLEPAPTSIEETTIDLLPPPRPGAGTPRVTGCLMTLNAARVLPFALESIAPFCSEIVAVDGGSTDGSLEVLRRFGCRILQRPWPGNHSHQRNRYLRELDTDWVFAIDSDEFVPPLYRDLIPRLTQIPDLAGVYFGRRHLARSRPQSYITSLPAGRDVQFRLFRYHRRLRYVGQIHEKVLGLRGRRLVLRDAPIYHLDWLLNSREARLAKLARYEARDPHSPWHRWCLYEDYATEFAPIPDDHLSPEMRRVLAGWSGHDRESDPPRPAAPDRHLTRPRGVA